MIVREDFSTMGRARKHAYAKRCKECKCPTADVTICEETNGEAGSMRWQDYYSYFCGYSVAHKDCLS
jgi:hypothetical protein